MSPSLEALIAATVVIGGPLTIAGLLIWAHRGRRVSIDQQLRRAARQAARDCKAGRHEWATPWKVTGDHPVYARTSSSVSENPIRYERSYMTTCRKCGEPRTKTVEV